MKQAKPKSLMRSRLKTRQLALLVHLDDERCVARAATAADMTQPAASKLLREIEADLEVKLFDRNARGVVPNWYGEILVRHARRVLSELDLAHEEIARVKSGFAGKAAIGSIMNPGTNLVPLSVAEVKRRYPAIHVSVEIDYSKTLVAKLLQGEVDVSVARVLDTEGADQLHFEPLADERYAVIAGGAHPLAGRGEVPLGDLVGQPWILPTPGSQLRDKLVNAFLLHGLSMPNNIVQSSALPLIMSLLRASHMVAPLPEDAMQPYLQAGLFAVLLKDLDIQIGSFGIITRRGSQLSPGAQIMLTALRGVAAGLYGGEAAPGGRTG